MVARESVRVFLESAREARLSASACLPAYLRFHQLVLLVAFLVLASLLSSKDFAAILTQSVLEARRRERRGKGEAKDKRLL